jgi:hypothetical protein
MRPWFPNAHGLNVHRRRSPMKKKQPSTKKRGGEANVGRSNHAKRLEDKKERKLEQGLEESMAGSDVVSVTQPSKT